MIDFSHLPAGEVGDLQIFNTPSTVTNIQWMTWRKPRGCSMAYMFCLAGGGGGGGGFTGVATTNRGGGGGGGTSSQSTLITPIFLLPDTLYVQVGAGGAGVGSGGGTAGTGIVSAVGVAPDTGARNLVLTANGGLGGGTGTGAAAGVAGGATGTAAVASMSLSGMGVIHVLAGVVGYVGGAQTGAIGTDAVIPGSGQLMVGGAGGAGTASANFAGGGVSSNAGALLSEWRPATPASGSNNGSGGSTFWKPFFNFGGCGGSSNNTGIGGMGGHASYGAGGGGGGGGTTGGTGGKGGNGIVIIYSW